LAEARVTTVDVRPAAPGPVPSAGAATGTVLEVRDLRTYFWHAGRRAFIRSVDGVDLDVAAGETLGVVGESGSGKSVTALSVMGLVDEAPGVVTGAIRVAGDDLLAGLAAHVRVTARVGEGAGAAVGTVEADVDAWRRVRERRYRGLRGRVLSMVFQNARAALHPHRPVGDQVAEAIRLHVPGATRREAAARAVDWLVRVRLDDPARRAKAYPAQLSGGMCQRVMIAMALASEPALLLADEPTTGLDATTQARIVDLLEALQDEATGRRAALVISHDIGVIRRLADRVAVMYAGQVVESGPASTLLAAGRDDRPRHPYTEALLAARPTDAEIAARARLRAIPGEVPDATARPGGCRFAPRCPAAGRDEQLRARCETEAPALLPVAGAHEIRCHLWASR
jgi:oligopeptide/dipeptide ABC transporter ATP-binding protein